MIRAARNVFAILFGFAFFGWLFLPWKRRDSVFDAMDIAERDQAAHLEFRVAEERSARRYARTP